LRHGPLSNYLDNQRNCRRISRNLINSPCTTATLYRNPSRRFVGQNRRFREKLAKFFHCSTQISIPSLCRNRLPRRL
jgi:hypothetical protein